MERTEESPAKRLRSEAQGAQDDQPKSDDTSKDESDGYFAAYDDVNVHILMLQDKSRVDAYASAIKAHKAAIEGKVVLDVGAGSGVLSLLAAKHGGAAKVYAVEAAPGMAQVARELAAHNRLDGVVKIIEGRIEDVELPEKVDVLISEWMGFYLVHESMLESVLKARDRWLKPAGLMLPQSAKVFAAVVEAEDLRQDIESLGDVHGLDLSALGRSAMGARCGSPQIEMIDNSRLLADPIEIVSWPDLRTLPVGASSGMSAEANFKTTRSGVAAAIAFWFDVGFGDSDVPKDSDIVLSTSPAAKATHWKQTLVYLGDFVQVPVGEWLPVNLALDQSTDNPRHYHIHVET